MSNEERAVFASSILVERPPSEAANVFLSRLLESKGLNNQIGSFLFDYMMINRHYANKLKKIYETKGKSLNQSIDQYIKKEAKHDPKYQNATVLNNDHLGDFGVLWNGVLEDIQEEVYISETFCNNMEKQLISPLKKCFDISKNKKYNNMLNSILELSKTAESVNLELPEDVDNENPTAVGGNDHKFGLGIKHGHKKTPSNLTNNEWALKSPETSENFENFEYNRLLFLKDAFISFQNNLNFKYNENLKHNENLFSVLVGFNPDDEIARFAKQESSSSLQKPLPPVGDITKRSLAKAKDTNVSNGSEDKNHLENGLLVNNRQEPVAKGKENRNLSSFANHDSIVAPELGAATAAAATAAAAGGAAIEGAANADAAKGASDAAPGNSKSLTNNDLPIPPPPQLHSQKSNPSTINSQGENKKRGGLRSKVGTLFGRRKTKNRHDSITSESISENPHNFSTFASQQSRPESAHFADRQSSIPRDSKASHMENELVTEKNTSGAVDKEDDAQNDAIGEKTINPRSSFIFNNDEQKDVTNGSEIKSPEREVDTGAANGRGSSLSINQRPLVPNVKSSSNTSIPKANLNEASTDDLHKSNRSSVLPPPPPPTRKTFNESNSSVTASTSESKLDQPVKKDRRDIQSKLFTNLTTADIMDQHGGNNNQERLSYIGEEQAVLPPLPKNASYSISEASKKHSSDNNSIGSGVAGVGSIGAFGHAHDNISTTSLPHSYLTSTKTGNKFVHPDLNSSGLNASISELIKVSLRDGETESCQIFGEIALTYVKPPLTQLPYKGYLKLVDRESIIEKLIPNNSFIETLEGESTPTDKLFSINPSQISSRTLGGLKYLVGNAESPIIILPVWRLEDHQASCMLTIKLSDKVINRLGQENSDELIKLENFIISVALEEGPEVKSAMSRPSGTFNKEKRRITWRYTEPLVLSRSKPEEKIVARFLTVGKAQESKKGALAKFLIPNNFGGKFVVSDVQLKYSGVESNIIQGDSVSGTKWEDVNTVKTFNTNVYTARSI